MVKISICKEEIAKDYQITFYNCPAEVNTVGSTVIIWLTQKETENLIAQLQGAFLQNTVVNNA